MLPYISMLSSNLQQKVSKNENFLPSYTHTTWAYQEGWNVSKFYFSSKSTYTAGIYLLKVNNRNTRYGVFFVSFELISHHGLVILLLTLNCRLGNYKNDPLLVIIKNGSRFSFQ